MKTGFLFTLLFCSFLAKAQTALTELFNAERSFAAYSVEHGMKPAFLKFLDSTGVVFEGGKAVNGLESWKKKAAGAGVLNWNPVFGDVAASGDLGFTTGPWIFQPKTVKDSILARGQYSTVWKKNKAGEWKAIVDLGNDRVPSMEDMMFVVADNEVKFIPGTWNNLLNREQKFITQTAAADSAARRKAYEKVAGEKACFLNRNGQWPSRYGIEVSRATSTMPAGIDYTINGSGISEARDLGYVYGTTVFNGKTENYLRIWRREGKEWKLVLEVLRY